MTWTPEDLEHLAGAARLVGSLKAPHHIAEAIRTTDEPVIAMLGGRGRYTLAGDVLASDYWTSLEEAAAALQVDLDVPAEDHRPPLQKYHAVTPDRGTYDRPTWRDVCRVGFGIDPKDVRVISADDEVAEGWSPVLAFDRQLVIWKSELRPLPKTDWCLVWSRIEAYLAEASRASLSPQRLAPLREALAIAKSCGALDLKKALGAELKRSISRAHEDVKRAEETSAEWRRRAHAALSKMLAGLGDAEVLDEALAAAERLSRGYRKIRQALRESGELTSDDPKLRPGPDPAEIDIAATLQAARGNISTAASELGIARPHLHVRMKQEGIRVVPVVVDSETADRVLDDPVGATEVLQSWGAA